MPESAAHGRYSIRLAARMTGISEHTLRVWERRYGFPDPERTPGGARRYSEAEVERLKLIQRALDAGYRAGDVVGQSGDELTLLLAAQMATPVAGAAPDIDDVVARVKADDVVAVRERIRQAVATFGPKHFVTDFAAPLLEEVGDQWAAGALSIQQEHLTSEALNTQLRVLLSGYQMLEGRPRVLLTTLSDEPHALGLEMVAVYLSVQGASTRMLGPSTPVKDIAAAAERLGVDVVGISISEAYPTRNATRRIGTLLRELPRHVSLWLGGAGAARPAVAKLATSVSSWSELDEALLAWRRER